MFDLAARSASRMVRAIDLGAGDDVAEAEFAGVAPGGAAQFVFERIDAQRILDRDLQALGADRLDDEIRRRRRASRR